MIPTPGGAIDDGRYLAFSHPLSYRAQRSGVEISRCGQARLPFAARPLGCARGDKRKAPWPLVEIAMPGRGQTPTPPATPSLRVCDCPGRLSMIGCVSFDLWH